MRHPAILLLVLLPMACGGGGGGGGPNEGATPLVIAAGVEGLEPAADDDWAASLDLDHLGLSAGDVRAVYDLTTPADTAFEFDLVTRAEGNTGPVRVSVSHAADDGRVPAGSVSTLAEVGIVPNARGTTSRIAWLDAHGDGFARMTLRGRISRDQVVAVETDNGDGPATALVRMRIGPESRINFAAASEGDYPGVLNRTTIYSSDSWCFGLPTVALSGDRTSVVCYEGDRADPRNGLRYELRLQHEAATNTVTGGGSEETSPDSGHWRDHEIAALYNVLALAHSGSGAVTLKLSFDRGATFAQTETLGTAGGRYSARLVQIAMALDYSLAVVFWRTSPRGESELVLVEGRPSAFDGGGSPAAFALDPPVVVYRNAADVTPLLLGAQYSEGGDLVIGYGFTRFTVLPNQNWESRTQNRCAVRPFGGDFFDVLVEETLTVGKDPSVALVGSGETMRIFFAYEGTDGVRLAVSADGGRTFAPPRSLADRGAAAPSIFVRDQGGATRVDLLYLTNGGSGTELHLLHWDDFDTTPPRVHRLTEAKMTPSADLDPGPPAPGAGVGYFAPDVGYRITEVAWFGYDAVLDGDDLVVVYDEQTYDGWICLIGPPLWDLDGGASSFDRGFTPAEPPPLAPGMTEPVDPPDPDHMHQLVLLRLD